jgi:hypothetical protein
MPYPHALCLATADKAGQCKRERVIVNIKPG